MESDEININELQNNSLENIQYLAFLLGFKQPTTESEKIRTVNNYLILFHLSSLELIMMTILNFLTRNMNLKI